MNSVSTEHGSDICECGDYRSQHDKGGPCRVCRVSSHPWDDCIKFRFANKADAEEAEQWATFYGSTEAQPKGNGQ